jgi:hypothetical protein
MPVPAAAAPKKSYIIVAATPDQATWLAQAQQMDGTISVTLCAVPKKDDEEEPGPDRVNVVPRRRDVVVTERELLGLPPRAAPESELPERIVVEEIRENKLTYVVFDGDDERLTHEKAWQDSLPASAKGPAASAGTAVKPKKPPCKKCEEAKKKAAAKAKAKAQGGSEPTPTPAPGATPTPTPAPRLPDLPSPEAAPQTT